MDLSKVDKAKVNFIMCMQDTNYDVKCGIDISPKGLAHIYTQALFKTRDFILLFPCYKVTRVNNQVLTVNK